MSEINNYSPRTEYDSKTSEIKFIPCVYQQRYSRVCEILQEFNRKYPMKKVIDFGCSELGFFTLLKSLPQLEHLIHIDIDEEVLNNNLNKVKPLLSDYLQPRKNPFHVQIFKGSIGEIDPIIVDASAIVCIELIEHLYPDVLEEVPYTIFGVSQPAIAIFTTPNIEYNILFSNPKRLRNYDHKFEWTRVQFQDWATNLCLRYPNYFVKFCGVGPPPNGYELIGSVTQVAIFTRSFTDCSVRNKKYENNYKLIYETQYPICSDKRTFNEQVLDEIRYYLERISNPSDEKYDGLVYDGNNRLLIPIKNVLSCVEKYKIKEEDIIKIITGSDLTICNDNYLVVDNSINDSELENDDVEVDSFCNHSFIPEPEEFWD